MPARELYLDARCELGSMLRKIERGTGPGRGKKKERGVPSFLGELERLHLAKPRAIECQRASCLPPAERRKVYKEAAEAQVRKPQSVPPKEAEQKSPDRSGEWQNRVVAMAKEAYITGVAPAI